MKTAYTTHTYRGVKILYYPESNSLLRSGWYVKGFFRCPTLRTAKEFIDDYESHVTAFCRVAKQILRDWK